MNGDDMLREAISALVDEIIADGGDPEKEIERITGMIETGFRLSYRERVADNGDAR